MSFFIQEAAIAYAEQQKREKAENEERRAKSKYRVVLSDKEERFSEKLAGFMKQRDIGIWEFVTSKNSLAKALGAGRLAVSSLRQMFLLRSKYLEKLLGEKIPEKDKKNKQIDWVANNRDKIRHLSEHAKAVPLTDFLRQAQLISRTQRYWEKAKKADDFNIVKPHFEKLVKHMTKIGAMKAERLGLSTPYEGLMDDLTPKLTEKRFSSLIEDTSNFCQKFSKVISKNQVRSSEEDNISWAMDKKTQEKLVLQVVKKMGFDFKTGQVGEASHPLCLGTLGDVRMTMTYYDDFTNTIMAAVHETGHAFYRQNLPKETENHPVGLVRNQALDESMSLLMANHVGHSKAFCKFLVKTMKEVGIDRPEITADSIFNHINKVEPGTNRLASDEVHYPMHVKLRYDVGRKLLSGEVEPKDMPKEWNKEFKKLFGIEVKSDKEGCMQDIHWFGGQFGYFPNYFCGKLISAQIMETAKKDLKDLDSNIENGNLKPLVSWLENKVYSKAGSMDMEDLVKSVTGKELGTAAYKQHIFNRYAVEPNEKGTQRKIYNVDNIRNKLFAKKDR